MIGRSLSHTGKYQVLEENRSWLAAATARRYSPDVVVLDLKMPVKSGKEVAAEFEADPALRQIPVIVLSAYTHEPERQIGDAAIYLAKPCDVTSLIDSVEILLARNIAA
jgi:DNA-binding response OmpR family regulator